MALKEELEAQGNWLFRRRSYLPLLMLPLLVLALPDAHTFERLLGDFGEDLWKIFCLIIAFGGLTIRIFTIGHTPKNTSGRNTSAQRAQTLNTTGVYSIVRHPLYLGNGITLVGISLSPGVWWFTLIVMLTFWVYYERIMLAEEEFLRRQFGTAFEEWAQRTPAVLPRFRNWTPPELSFSWKNVLKREYSGFFGIIAAFTGIEIMHAVIIERRWELEPGWIILLLIGGAVYLTLRTIRKKTHFFDVDGR